MPSNDTIMAIMAFVWILFLCIFGLARLLLWWFKRQHDKGKLKFKVTFTDPDPEKGDDG